MIEYIDSPMGIISLHLKLVHPYQKHFYISSQVPNSYYPVRKLSSLTLYQDAQSADSANVRGSRNCFEDIYNSILTAKKFIYISGR